MISPADGPGRASTEPKRLSLLIESEKASGHEGVPQFCDLRRLSRLQFCDHDGLIFEQLKLPQEPDRLGFAFSRTNIERNSFRANPRILHLTKNICAPCLLDDRRFVCATAPCLFKIVHFAIRNCSHLPAPLVAYLPARYATNTLTRVRIPAFCESAPWPARFQSLRTLAAHRRRPGFLTLIHLSVRPETWRQVQPRAGLDLRMPRHW